MRGDYNTLKLIFLDGKIATPQEALVNGRAVMGHEKGNILYIASDCQGPDAVMEGSDPQNGIYKVFLGHSSVQMEVEDYWSKKMKTGRYDLRFLLDVVDGKIVKGVAISSRLSALPYHELDVSGLTVTDGKIEGTATAKFVHPQKPDEEPIVGTYTLSASVGDASVIGGEMSGRCGDTELKGPINGQLLPRGVPVDPGRLWLRIGAPNISGGMIFAVFAVKEGVAQPDGITFWQKGGVNGTIIENTAHLDLQSQQLKGTMESVLTNHGEGECKIAVDASVLGGRWVFGPATVTLDGKTAKGRVRGGLVPANSPFCGITDEVYQQYRALLEASKSK